jgi:hypothetical protein
MRLVTRLQCLLRERLARCRITVEVNPTSNLLIGGFNDYAELPYRVMTDSGLAVSINTDDPGLFMTSLPNEFAALYHSLVGPMPHQAVSQWLQGRRLDAANSTFLRLGTPIGADAAAASAPVSPLSFGSPAWCAGDGCSPTQARACAAVSGRCVGRRRRTDCVQFVEQGGMDAQLDAQGAGQGGGVGWSLAGRCAGCRPALSAARGVGGGAGCWRAAPG